MSTAKTIAVLGATGAQGGGVVNVLSQTPGWKVRAITRNPDGEKGKALAARGIEVVAANADDEESLKKAFNGVQAVFAVTNFWEHFFAGKSQQTSGEIEEEQAMKIARAAAATPTLEHFIWSTLPDPHKLTNGEIHVPHFDYKVNANERINKELPDLAKKTTFLFVGYYPKNMVFFPFFKPFEPPGSDGKYIQLMPTPADAKIPVSGDMATTPGIWVRQILALGSKTFQKSAMVAPEVLSWGEMLSVWGEVTGRQTVFVTCSSEAAEQLHGVFGNEMVLQFRFCEAAEDWTKGSDFLGMAELGIKREDVGGLREALVALKEML